jgi:hypothetical protein
MYPYPFLNFKKARHIIPILPKVQGLIDLCMGLSRPSTHVYRCFFTTNGLPLPSFAKSLCCKAESKGNGINFDWLAGLIDGCGHFVCTSPYDARLDITVSAHDSDMLQALKAHFGGHIKRRAGGHSLRYRLTFSSSNTGLARLIQSLSGRLWNITKQQQLVHLCNVLGIKLFSNQPNAFNSAYASGLFDGAGSVLLHVFSHKAAKNIPGLTGKIARLTQATSVQLVIGIEQRHAHNLSSLTTSNYNEQRMGRLHYHKARKGRYAWQVQCRNHIGRLLHYFELYPCRSIKTHRLALINRYYQLMDAGALQTTDVALAQQWSTFVKHWYRFEKV